MGRAAETPAHDAIVCAPFGRIGLRCTAEVVTEIEYLPAGPARAGEQPLAREAARQIEAYLSDPSFVFDLPFELLGTPFRRRVWKLIADIPRGATRTYGDLARDLVSAPRAVGQACGANPLPIMVPCHRVVATGKGFNGGLGGFAHSRGGFLLEAKRWLLRHEGALAG
ncbi:MAG: methylated-DNA--[protein]-cysteine S-methyltransferase [Rhodocyclaceae bacterium]